MSRKDVTDVDVVAACRDSHDDRGAWVAGRMPGATNVHLCADELLAARTGQPRKVCERALERACSRGLVDFGVSLRTAWPTPAGLALLGVS